MAYMDNMDLDVRRPRKASRLNHLFPYSQLDCYQNMNIFIQENVF